MAWHVEGTYFENCSCDVSCPCTVTDFAVPGDYDPCQFMFAFHVQRGEVDGVDVSDRTVAVVGEGPAEMTKGNWRVGLVVDDRASDEQREKLSGVFSGQMGGPMGAVAPLVSEILGVESMPIEYADDGKNHRIRIGDAVDVEIEDITSPFADNGGSPQVTGVHHPANATLTVAKSTRSRISALGLDFSAEGKSGFSAPFSWSS